MASIELLDPALKCLAKGMPPALVERLSQTELDLRLKEVERIHKNAQHLPAPLYRGRIAKAYAVRDAIPYPEFKQRMDAMRASLARLPGTGRAALSARDAYWGAMGSLKRDNQYADGIEQAMAPVMAGGGK